MLNEEELKIVVSWTIDRLIFISIVFSLFSILLSLKLLWDTRFDEMFKGSIPKYFIENKRRNK